MLERVGKAAVIIERVDSNGRWAGIASGCIDSRGFVITNRHCVEGAAGVKLNLGAAGLFDLPTLVAETEELDVDMLKGDFPADAAGRLEWAESSPRPHSQLRLSCGALAAES